MKLAEALILRADSQKRLEQLKQRLTRSAKVQEGDEPAENPSQLLQEFEQIAGELTSLIQRINRTNSTTSLEGTNTLADVLAVRDVLQIRVTGYRGLAEAAVINQDRYSRSEVKFKSTVSIADIQKQVDQLSKEHRELDARIQAANWLTELLD